MFFSFICSNKSRIGASFSSNFLSSLVLISSNLMARRINANLSRDIAALKNSIPESDHKSFRFKQDDFSIPGINNSPSTAFILVAFVDLQFCSLENLFLLDSIQILVFSAMSFIISLAKKLPCLYRVCSVFCTITWYSHSQYISITS